MIDKEKDTQELQEVVDMLRTEEDNMGVVAHLSDGNYVVIPEYLFKKVLSEMHELQDELGEPMTLFSQNLPEEE